MNKSGGILASLIGDIVLLISGFICGYLFGDTIIKLVRGWLHI